VTFTDPTNRWVAGHLADEVKVQSEESGMGTKPRGSRGSFAARVPSTNNNHVKDFIERHCFCFLGYGASIETFLFSDAEG